MKKIIQSLYTIAGENSKKITKMLVYDFLKAIFEAMSLGGIMFCILRICENIFNQRILSINDVYIVFVINLISVIGKIVFGYLGDKNKYIASYSLGAENRLYIGDRLKNVNMGYFSENALGKISGGLSTVLVELETVGMIIIEQLLVGIIQTVIMIIMIMPYDYITGLIILLVLAVSIFVNALSQKKLDNSTESLLNLKLDLNSKIIEYVKGMGVTKAFGKEENTSKELKESIENTRKGFLDVEKHLIPNQFMFLLVFKIGISIIIFTTLLRFLGGSIEATKAILLIMASFVVFSGFELAGSMHNLRGIALKNLETTMKLRNLPIIKDGNKKEIKKAEIKIEDITFSYEDNAKLFKNFNLTIPEGKTTALVGFSGSGKTSICNLIARFWDVDKGRILIDGIDVKDYRYDNLLSNFSFVFQDVYLFDDTIRNNIAFGKPDAKDAEIEYAAKLAQCHKFIKEMPDGYNTVLQEGGANLSGGEKQRISIARALLKPSKFVILDEATSNIDPEQEREVLTAIKNLLKNKTVIVIAHKLSTVQNADQIVVLEDGEIKQKGTHKKLLNEEGIYKDFIKIREKSEVWTI